MPEMFAPPLIQAQTWQEAQRKFNEALQQLSRQLRHIYTGANIPTSRIADGAIIASKIYVTDLVDIANLLTVASGKIIIGENAIGSGLHGIKINDGTRDRVYLGEVAADTYGLRIIDSDGNLIINNAGRIIRGTFSMSRGVLYGTNDQTLNSTTWTELDNTSQDMTTKKCIMFIIAFNRANCSAYAPDSYANCELGVEVGGGTPNTGNVAFSAHVNAEKGVVVSDAFALAAGAHTARAMWKCGSANQTWVSKTRGCVKLWFDVP